MAALNPLPRPLYEPAPDVDELHAREARAAVAANQAAAQRFITSPAPHAAALDALHASSVAAARTGAERRAAAMGLDPACLPHRQGRA